MTQRTRDASVDHDSIPTWGATGNLSRRASLNGLASALDFVARITVQFLLTPLLVSGLGRYLYGAWRVLWQLSGYLWATSGRSAQALQMVIANHQHSSDPEEKRRYVGSAVIVWFLFLPVLVGVGVLGVWLAPGLLKAPPRHTGAIRATAALISVDAIALALLTIPRSVLQGQNLGYKRMGLSTLLVAFGGGLMALAIVLDTGIVGVAAAQVVTTVLTGVLFWRVAKRYVPWFGISKPSRPTVRWFLGLSGWFMGWKYVFELMTAADVIVLGFFGSVELVAVYSLTKFIPDALIPLAAVFLQGSGAGLGGLIGKGHVERAARVRNEIMAITWLLVTVVGATFLLLDASFVSLWIGPKFYAGPVPALLILLLVTQFIFIGIDARIIDLSLAVRAKVLLGVASAIISVALAIIFLEWFDRPIVGVCLGMMIGRATLTLAYPWLVGRFLHYPLIEQVRGVVRPIVTSGCLFGAALVLGRHVDVNSWPALVLLTGGTATSVAVAAGFAGFTPNQRRSLLIRAWKVVGR